MESLLFFAILILAGGVLTLSADRRFGAIAALCGVIAVGGWFLWSPDVDEELAAALPGEATQRGFTTSDACQTCHPGRYDGWHRSFHRTMTQEATPSTVLGSFDGVVLEDRGFTYRFERRGDQFWVEMPDPLWFREPSEGMPARPPRIEARVVMTTGSHHIQNYWVRRPDTEEVYLRPDDGALVQFPWVWLIDEKRWVPNQDSFLTPPSSTLETPHVWNGNCSKCHSVATEPASESYDRYDTRSVELGIACEACHGPAAQHVRSNHSPLRRYIRYFLDISGEDRGDPTIVHPARLEQRRSVETCGQCHSFNMERDLERYWKTGVAFHPGDELAKTRAVFRYTEDPTDPLLLEVLRIDPLALDGRFWPDGTIRVAGREYNGLLESACFQVGQMTCLSCHSMHEYEQPADQLDPDFTGNRSCLGCHTYFQDQITEHTRHTAESPGSECMNCHMPHTTYGLFSAQRSHRIDNPSAQVSVQTTGRPNACNLCHLDETLEWTSRYLSDWYGQPPVELSEGQRSVAASILWALKGDAAQRTIIGWHMGWGPAQEASGRSWLAPYLGQLLVDSYALTRQTAYRSLLTLPGFSGFEFDYLASRPELKAKADDAMAVWLRVGGADRAEPHLLLDEDGRIDLDEWFPIVAERDHRPLRIIE